MEARPPPVRVSRDVKLAVGGDRTEDLQAEARAMARAANASVYSPELLASNYGSRPVKVALYLLPRLLLFVLICTNLIEIVSGNLNLRFCKGLLKF